MPSFDPLAVIQRQHLVKMSSTAGAVGESVECDDDDDDDDEGQSHPKTHVVTDNVVSANTHGGGGQGEDISPYVLARSNSSRNSSNWSNAQP